MSLTNASFWKNMNKFFCCLILAFAALTIKHTNADLFPSIAKYKNNPFLMMLENAIRKISKSQSRFKPWVRRSSSTHPTHTSFKFAHINLLCDHHFSFVDFGSYKKESKLKKSSLTNAFRISTNSNYTVFVIIPASLPRDKEGKILPVKILKRYFMSCSKKEAPIRQLNQKEKCVILFLNIGKDKLENKILENLFDALPKCNGIIYADARGSKASQEREIAEIIKIIEKEITEFVAQPAPCKQDNLSTDAIMA